MINKTEKQNLQNIKIKQIKTNKYIFFIGANPSCRCLHAIHTFLVGVVNDS